MERLEGQSYTASFESMLDSGFGGLPPTLLAVNYLFERKPPVFSDPYEAHYELQSIGVRLNGLAHSTTPRGIYVQDDLPDHIPEPGLLALLCLGLAGLGLSRRRESYSTRATRHGARPSAGLPIGGGRSTKPACGSALAGVPPNSGPDLPGFAEPPPPWPGPRPAFTSSMSPGPTRWVRKRAGIRSTADTSPQPRWTWLNPDRRPPGTGSMAVRGCAAARTCRGVARRSLRRRWRSSSGTCTSSRRESLLKASSTSPENTGRPRPLDRAAAPGLPNAVSRPRR